jgi:hypothetical protein
MKKILFITFSILFSLTNQAQIITTVAGGSCDGRAAINTPIKYPEGVAIDSSGNIYIADCNNHKIKKVSASTGIITTVAGLGNVYGVGQGSTSSNGPAGNNVIATNS